MARKPTFYPFLVILFNFSVGPAGGIVVFVCDWIVVLNSRGLYCDMNLWECVFGNDFHNWLLLWIVWLCRLY